MTRARVIVLCWCSRPSRRWFLSEYEIQTFGVGDVIDRARFGMRFARQFVGTFGGLVPLLLTMLARVLPSTVAAVAFASAFTLRPAFAFGLVLDSLWLLPATFACTLEAPVHIHGVDVCLSILVVRVVTHMLHACV